MLSQFFFFPFRCCTARVDPACSHRRAPSA